MDAITDMILEYACYRTGRFLIGKGSLGYLRLPANISYWQFSLISALGAAFWFFSAWGMCLLYQMLIA